MLATIAAFILALGAPFVLAIIVGIWLGIFIVMTC